MKDTNTSNKEEKKLQKLISDYNLDNLTEEDLTILKKISSLVNETSWYKDSFTSSITTPDEKVKYAYTETLIEQNWMIIKLLSSLNNKIDKLNL